MPARSSNPYVCPPPPSPRTRAVNMGDGMVEIKTRSTRWLDRNCPCQAGFEFFDYTGQRAGWGITEGTECCQQCRQEEVNPSIGFALHHPEQAPLHALERIRFQVDQNKQEPVFRRWQGAVLVHGKPTRGSRLPIHPPRRHPGLECRFEGRDQLLKLVEGQAREIQELSRAGLQLGEP